MNRIVRNAGVATALIAGSLLVQGAVLYMLGARVNTSPSIPLGLYWRVNAPVARGAYVLFCPPQVGVFEEALRRGYLTGGWCPGGYGYMMKRVMGITGDVVDISHSGVRVNGRLLAHSVLLLEDSAHRPMPRFQSSIYVLSEYQLLLMADASVRSFDARYFGPVQRGQVKEVIVPVLTWGAAKETGK